MDQTFFKDIHGPQNVNPKEINENYKSYLPNIYALLGKLLIQKYMYGST
jgi:hypothetical protein